LVVYALLTLLGEELADRYRRSLLFNHTQLGGVSTPQLELLPRGVPGPA
jgi:hypothetical protein